MKIPKLNHWSIEISDYNITFVHTKGTNNINADAVYRLNTRYIQRPLGNPKTVAINNTEECITEVVTNNIHTLSSDRLHAEQNEITCRNLAPQLCHKNRNSFNPDKISADGPLQKEQYVHGLTCDVMAPCSIIPIILLEFQNTKSH